MNKYLKIALCKTQLGQKFLHQRTLRKSVFTSACPTPFNHLNKFGRQKEIDRVYNETFNKLFILMYHLHLQGDIFEFGVFNGYSAHHFARKIATFFPGKTALHLFDSFEGLPEEKGLDREGYEYKAGFWKKGLMQVPEGIETYMEKKLGKIISPKQVHLVKGYFEDTVEKHFRKYPGIKAKLVHMDCDLYSSSKFVLDFLLRHDVIQDGTILLFDDWMTSCGNPNLGQRKATAEVLALYPHWTMEMYLNYGGGSHAFIAHDLRVGK